MKSTFRRIGGFTASTALTAVATVLSIPLVVAAAGAAAWSHLVVGQTIGTFVAVVTAWGWAITGPVEVAAADPASRPGIYRRSLGARSLLLAPSIAVILVVVPLLVGADGGEATISAVSVVVGALGASWYFVGCGDPRRLLLVDTAPRVLGVLVGACAVAGGAPLVWAPLVQLAGSLVAVVGAAVQVGRAAGEERRATPRVGMVALLRAQSSGVLTAAASSLYLALPLVLVSRLVPEAAPSYAIADRLLRYGVLAAVPVAGFAQSWVPSGDRSMLVSRAKRACRASLVFGAVGAVVFLCLGPAFSGVLSGGEASFGFALAAPYALAAAAILASQITGLAVLLAFGQKRSLALSTLIGLLTGCVLIPAGAVAYGAPGAAWGLAISELVVLAYQLLRATGALRSETEAQRAPAELAVPLRT